jgi:hypothetical protein
MPGLRGLADDHDGTAQSGLGDQAAEQASQSAWPQSASLPRPEHRPGLGTAGPCSGLVGLLAGLVGAHPHQARRRPSTLRVGSPAGTPPP